MSVVKKHPHGTFCWPELSTTDGDGAKVFYKGVFGWDLHDDEVSPDQVYTMASVGGKSVGAMFQQSKEMRGAPPHWLSYVSVDDLDERVEKAKELGGAVTAGPMDVFDIGRMAVFTDPTGAMFAMWQPKKHIGAELINEHGALCWNELWTNDEDRSGAFYTKLFGWGSETADMGATTYTSFMNGKRPAGGMMKIKPEMGPVPPNWLVYFAVNDCESTIEKVEALGGKTLYGPQDIPEVGRFAVLQDPQGAAFAAIKLNAPVEGY